MRANENTVTLLLFILRDDTSLENVGGSMMVLIVPLIKTNDRRIYSFVRVSCMPSGTQRGKQFVNLGPLNGLKERAPNYNYNCAFVFVKAAAAFGATTATLPMKFALHAINRWKVN